MNADEIRKQASDGLDAITDEFGNATEHVESVVKNAREQFMKWEKEGLECAKDAARSADQFVQEKPWQAAGIAAALGLVAGLLIRRR